MAVTVEMHNTGDSDVKADVVASIEHALADRPGDWRAFRRLGSRILRGCQREMRYFSRMLNERFLRVTTTLPSRASQPIAHSKMGPFPSASFLSCASESSPWVLRACQIAPATWPISSSMVFPILHYLTSKMSGGACYPGEEGEEVRSRILRGWVAMLRGLWL